MTAVRSPSQSALSDPSGIQRTCWPFPDCFCVSRWKTVFSRTSEFLQARRWPTLDSIRMLQRQRERVMKPKWRFALSVSPALWWAWIYITVMKNFSRTPSEDLTEKEIWIIGRAALLLLCYNFMFVSHQDLCAADEENVSAKHLWIQTSRFKFWWQAT